MSKASDIAASWTTCACGNQCAILDRDKTNNNSPVDEILTNLGSDFGDQVYDMWYAVQRKNELETDFENNKNSYGVESKTAHELRVKGWIKEFDKKKKEAIKTLIKIEKRSAKLIVLEIKKIKTKASYVGLKLVKA